MFVDAQLVDSVLTCLDTVHNIACFGNLSLKVIIIIIMENTVMQNSNYFL